MRKHLLKIITAVSALAALAAAPGAASAATYTITDLGNGAAYAINDNGQIAGSRRIQGYTNLRPVVWSNGSFNYLGSLADGGVAYGINNLGQAVGISYSLNGTRAVLFSNGTVTDLGGWTAFGINDSGQIAGTISYDTVAFWDRGTLTQLAYAGDFVGPVAINNAGQVAGRSEIPGGRPATIWDNGIKTILPSLAGSYYTWANCINELGHAAGYGGFSNNTSRAALWANGTVTDLGTMDAISSFAYGINDLDQVVGQVKLTRTDGDVAAFIYENGVMINLNSLLVNGDGWILEDARDINNKGQIVGYGIHNGVRHAYVMNPVPLPPAFFMFGSGLIGLLGARRKFFKG